MRWLWNSVKLVFEVADFHHRKWAFKNNRYRPDHPEYLRMSHKLYEYERRGFR